VIRKFTIVPDHSKLGRSVTTFILVSSPPAPDVSRTGLSRRIRKLEGVWSVHLISAEYDILVKVRGESVQSIGALVIGSIKRMEGVGRTITCSSFPYVKEKP